jgi:hypothetical protein
MPGNRMFTRLVAAFLAGVLIPALLLFTAASFGWLSFDGVTPPPKWEERFGQAALEASLSRRAAGLKNPVSASDTELLAGIKSYRSDCAGCHGDSSGSSSWGSRNFYPRVPQFAQHPPELTPAEMFVAIKYGIRYSGMGGWNGILPDRRIWEIVLFLSRLNSLPPSVELTWTSRQ